MGEEEEEEAQQQQDKDLLQLPAMMPERVVTALKAESNAFPPSRRSCAAARTSTCGPHLLHI